MNIVEAIAKLEELRKQHGEDFEADVIPKTTKETKGTQESDLIFHTGERMYDVTGYDPDDIVVLVDKLPPDFETQDIVFCQVKNLQKALDYCRKRNAGIKMDSSLGDLVDKIGFEILALANPTDMVWRVDSHNERWLDYTNKETPITEEKAAGFCKRANEYRRKNR